MDSLLFSWLFNSVQYIGSIKGLSLQSFARAAFGQLKEGTEQVCHFPQILVKRTLFQAL